LGNNEVEEWIGLLSEALKQEEDHPFSNAQVDNEVLFKDNLAAVKEAPFNDNLAAVKEAPFNDNLAAVKEVPFNDNLAAVKEAPFNDNLAAVKEVPFNDNLAAVKEALSVETAAELLRARPPRIDSKLGIHPTTGLMPANKDTSIRMPLHSEWDL
jgi:hypothetical protein